MIGSLLDTSFVVAVDEPEWIPSSAAVSVVTLGELHAGVLRAPDERVRTLRQRRLVYVRTRFEPIPVDETVVQSYGELLAFARSKRRPEKATDLLIAATAWATGRTLHTFDSQQAELARAVGISVTTL